MKIGLLTMFDSNNYGAAFQALSTIIFLRQNGFDAEIIKYKNVHEKNGMRLAYKENDQILGYVKSFAKNTIFGRRRYYKRAFSEYLAGDYFSTFLCESERDLLNAEYDILIAGSDQIWNPIITGGIDHIFLLDFPTRAKKIAFSTSMGSYVLTEKERNFYKKALNDYHAISVREEFAKKQLELLCDKEIRVVMDPSFLLNGDDWLNYYSKSQDIGRGEKYILTYFISSKKNDYKDIVKKYKEKTGLKVWSIQYSNYSWDVTDKKLLGLKMGEFIKVFNNATIILTDSFHGVAFSLNLKKQFWALVNSTNPVRVRELLSTIGLENRICQDYIYGKEIDYDLVGIKLGKRVEYTKKWMQDVIADCGDDK